MPLLPEAVLACAAIIIVAQVLGRGLARLGQPRVIGQILAGVLLGPTVLDVFGAGGAFDPLAAATIERIGNLALVVFMLVVGLELDVHGVLARGRVVRSIAAASVAIPFACGAAIALVVHARHASVDGAGVDLAAFTLFLGTAFAVSSFPVLAAILKESGLVSTRLGGLALASAAVGDVAAWTLLAAALGAAQAAGAASLLAIGTQAALLLLVVRYAVRPLVLAPISARISRRGTARVTDALLVCAIATAAAVWTDAIGLHAVLGAFVVGAAMPRSTAVVAPAIARALRPFLSVLAPLAFAAPGLALDLGQIARADAIELLVVLLAACGSKLAGVATVARRRGVGRRDALALGVLLNTRGLVEVVVLMAGRSAGLLDDRLFAILLTMALATTVVTAPLLRLVLGRKLDASPGLLDAGATAPAWR